MNVHVHPDKSNVSPAQAGMRRGPYGHRQVQRAPRCRAVDGCDPAEEYRHIGLGGEGGGVTPSAGRPTAPRAATAVRAVRRRGASGRADTSVDSPANVRCRSGEPPSSAGHMAVLKSCARQRLAAAPTVRRAAYHTPLDHDHGPTGARPRPPMAGQGLQRRFPYIRRPTITVTTADRLTVTTADRPAISVADKGGTLSGEPRRNRLCGRTDCRRHRR